MRDRKVVARNTGDNQGDVAEPVLVEEAIAVPEEPKTVLAAPLTPAERLEQVKRVRADKLAARKEAAERLRVSRELAALELLEAAEEEYGAGRVDVVDVGDQFVIVKCPPAVIYDEFQDVKDPKVKHFKRLLYKSLVTDAGAVDDILRVHPAALAKLCGRAIQLAAGERNELTGE